MDNQIVILEKYAYGGEYIAHLSDGRTAFVPLGMPGEQVEIEITENKERYARGRIVKTLISSPDRIAAPCHLGNLGGTLFGAIINRQDLHWHYLQVQQ